MTEALAAIKAEVAAEPAGVTVPLVTDDGTVDILVPPPSMWFEGAVEALTQGRVSEWIRLAVEDPAMIAAWDSVPRKRYRDLNAFLEEWTRLSGESQGKSPASTPSSRNTRGR
ncbi:MAG: hypothetical protein JWO67_758 [Streptosporangiaceae bacterium]|nr:hypothetical protein [Streptosporangiaceae bacterium]